MDEYWFIRPYCIWTKNTLSVSFLVLLLISLTGNMKTPTLVLLTTNTALLPGESAEFRCAITSHRPMTANFRLYRNGRYMQTKAADQKMVTFSLSTLASSDKGNYTCDYYYQGERNVSSSKSNAITITIGKCMQNDTSCIYSSTWLLSYNTILMVWWGFAACSAKVFLKLLAQVGVSLLRAVHRHFGVPLFKLK